MDKLDSRRKTLGYVREKIKAWKRARSNGSDVRPASWPARIGRFVRQERDGDPGRVTYADPSTWDDAEREGEQIVILYWDWDNAGVLHLAHQKWQGAELADVPRPERTLRSKDEAIQYIDAQA